MSVYVKLLRCDVYGGVYYPNPDVKVTMPYFTGVVNPLMFTGAPIQIKWSYILWKLFKQWRTIATYLQFDVSLQPRRVYARRTKGYGHTYTTRWININGNRNYLDKNYLNQTMQLPEYRKVSSSISITFSKRNERRLWEVVRWEFTRENKRDLSSDIFWIWVPNISLVTTHNNLRSEIGIPYPYIE